MDATYVKTMLEEGKLDEEEVMDELMTPAEILYYVTDMREPKVDLETLRESNLCTKRGNERRIEV